MAELYLRDSQEKSTHPQRGFSECMVQIVDRAKNGDFVSVAHEQDADSLRNVIGFMRPFLDVEIEVRLSADAALQL